MLYTYVAYLAQSPVFAHAGSRNAPTISLYHSLMIKHPSFASWSPSSRLSVAWSKHII
jgi:hypothetical protein